MSKRNIIKEMEKGLFDKTLSHDIERLSDKSDDSLDGQGKTDADNDHVTETSSINFYFYDYTNKINDPIEDKTEFGPFESYEDNYGIFSHSSSKLYALSNSADQKLFVNSEEYNPFQKVPVGDGDVVKIADFRYVISDQKIFNHQNAKKVMGKLLVKKSTSGTQKSIEERESNIRTFEVKIQERQDVINSLEEKINKMADNSKKAADLKLKIKRWIQDIEETKRIVIFLEKEILQLSDRNYEEEINIQENEIRRLEETKFKLVEKAKLSKEKLRKMQEADEKKKEIRNNKISDIEREEKALEDKLNELKKKKSILKD